MLVRLQGECVAHEKTGRCGLPSDNVRTVALLDPFSERVLDSDAFVASAIKDVCDGVRLGGKLDSVGA